MRVLPRLLLARDTLPWGMGSGRGPWNLALRSLASTKDPSALQHETLVAWDDHTYAIYDGYPKAQFHFLILPRIPFVVEEETPNGEKKHVTVPIRDMESIGALLESRHARTVLARIAAMEQRVRTQHSCRWSSIFAHVCVRRPSVLTAVRHSTPKARGMASSGVSVAAFTPCRRCATCIYMYVAALTQVISDDLISDRLKQRKVH